MLSRLLTTGLIALLPGALLAQGSMNYECNYGELVRRVVVVHEPGVRVPCEVHYYKDIEAPGEHVVLWRALHEAGYCEARADELTARLTSLGWKCDPSERPAMPPEEKIEESLDEAVDAAAEDAVDDTDILEPADPAAEGSD